MKINDRESAAAARLEAEAAAGHLDDLMARIAGCFRRWELEDWKTILDKVPAHTTSIAAELAKWCFERWLGWRTYCKHEAMPTPECNHQSVCK